MWRRFFWRACFLADQISFKGSWECKGGREGVRCGRPHQGWGGGLMLHPACRDALLVGRLGSSATPSSSSSSFPQNSPYKRGCHRALQKFWHQCRGCTLHMKPYTQLMVTNVFSEKSQVSIKHRRAAGRSYRYTQVYHTQIQKTAVSDWGDLLMTAWIHDVFVFIDSCGEKPNNLY